MSDYRRILEMFLAQQITINEAEDLLSALNDVQQSPVQSPKKHLRVKLQSQADGRDINLNITVPMQLARFALNMLPENARQAVVEQGIDIQELLVSLKEDTVHGELINIQNASDGQDFSLKIEVA